MCPFTSSSHACGNLKRMSGTRRSFWMKVVGVAVIAQSPAGGSANGPGRNQNARELRRFNAPEATQAAAVDATHFFAIGNRIIAQYSKKTGERLRSWTATADMPLEHLNSGVVLDGRLYLSAFQLSQLSRSQHDRNLGRRDARAHQHAQPRHRRRLADLDRLARRCMVGGIRPLHRKSERRSARKRCPLDDARAVRSPVAPHRGLGFSRPR